MNGGGGRCVWQRVPQLIVKSAPINCKADRLSAFCTSRAKMSAIRTRHDKTTLLVTKGDKTYKKILNKSNATLAPCLHLLATFGLECRTLACKKNTICKKVGGGGRCASAPLPLPVRRLCIIIIITHHIITLDTAHVNALQTRLQTAALVLDPVCYLACTGKQFQDLFRSRLRPKPHKFHGVWDIVYFPAVPTRGED